MNIQERELTPSLEISTGVVSINETRRAGAIRTFHEHQNIRRVEPAACPRDRSLDRAKALANRQRDDRRVVRGDLRRVRVHLRVERLRAN